MIINILKLILISVFFISTAGFSSEREKIVYNDAYDGFFKHVMNGDKSERQLIFNKIHNQALHDYKLVSCRKLYLKSYMMFMSDLRKNSHLNERAMALVGTLHGAFSAHYFKEHKPNKNTCIKAAKVDLKEKGLRFFSSLLFISDLKSSFLKSLIKR